ncbi:MAG TPA: hypothetical protein VG165_13365 [Solirubrobacteraceae bacterium]|jgi:hypothetical protein|nr:hypothetical protein [Solirubrobacteraceae bacterium]
MTRAPALQSGRRTAAVSTLTCICAVMLAGCSDTHAPPGRSPRQRPTVVATAITAGGVSISPDHLGAGPVKLVITNMTHASQQLAVASTDAGTFRQETAPINPQDMAQLRARLVPGSYTVSVRAAGVKSASLAVAGGLPARP